MRRFFLILLVVILTISPFSSYAQDENPEFPLIVITISLYLVVDDADNPNPDMLSGQTLDDLDAIVETMNNIWAQANIVFEPQYIGLLELPTDVLEDVMEEDFSSFFEQIGDNFDVPNRSWINGLYFKRLGRLSGISFPETIPGYYFVSDTSIAFENRGAMRISAHEVGHILGLHHAVEDNRRLMFGGTPGTNLTQEEIIVTRYIASGIVDDLRTSH